MKDKLFRKLEKGMQEAIAIERREFQPARVTIYFEPKEIKKIRNTLEMSQKEFSDRFGIPITTIRHWEQGRRKPDRTAMAFYRILAKEPKAALAAFS